MKLIKRRDDCVLDLVIITLLDLITSHPTTRLLIILCAANSRTR